jgi:sugar phosphate isomerase/epimerase
MPYPGPISLFVKPWAARPLEHMAAFATSLGVTGVELPVRPGLTVEPANCATMLPEAARVFAGRGLAITSVAAPLEDSIIAACHEAGVTVLRTMPSIGGDESYLEAESRWRRVYESKLGFLRDHGVRLAVQHHTGDFITSAAGLRRLIEPLPADTVGAVWDPGHCALSGEAPRHALDLLHDRLMIVNLKSPRWVMEGRGPRGDARWRRTWVSARDGMTDFRAVFALLRQRNWTGQLLHFAEYSDEARVDELSREDMAHWQMMLEEAFR